MRWCSERIDDHVKRILLDSSWVEHDETRMERLATHLALFDGDLGDLLDRVRSHATLCLFERSVQALRATGRHDKALARLPLDHLAAEAARVRGWIDRYYRELRKVQAAAAREGIQPVALKGAAWEVDVYHGTRTRSFSDLDLYVARDELDRFGKVLERFGYRQATFDPESKRLIDVSEERNRAALASGRHATPYIKYDPEHDRFLRVEPHGPVNDENFHKIDTSVFFEGVRALPLGGLHGRQLSVVDALVYACAHIRKNLYVHPPLGRIAMPRLRWYCDVRQMFLTHTDPRAWDGLYDRARELGRLGAVYQTLVYTERLFPDVVPEHLLSAPADLPGGPERAIDDVWWSRGGTSSFEQRLFEPHIDESRYLRLRREGVMGGRLRIPRVDRVPDLPAALTGPSWHGATVHSISGTGPAPRWQYFGTHVSFGRVPDSDADFSAAFAAVATSDELAIVVDVSDRRLCFHQKSGYYHAQDCVQLLFEVPYESRSLYNVLLVPRAADLDGPAAVFHHAGHHRAGTEAVPGARVEARIGRNGYTVLARLPLTVLGITPETTTFGFDICVYDSGDPGEERRTVLQWSGGRNALRNPSFFGTATLEGGAGHDGGASIKATST